MVILEQNNNDKIEMLKRAIIDKLEVSFWYKGKGFRDPNNKKNTKQGWRFIQPTDLGKGKYSGRLMLRGYQLTGTTNTKNKSWKTFLVDEISSVTIMDGLDGGYKPFKEPSGPNFNRYGDKKMSNDRPDIKIDINKEPAEPKGNLRESGGFLNWLLNKE